MTCGRRDALLEKLGLAASRRAYERLNVAKLAVSRALRVCLQAELTIAKRIVGFLRWASAELRRGRELEALRVAFWPQRHLSASSGSLR